MIILTFTSSSPQFVRLLLGPGFITIKAFLTFRLKLVLAVSLSRHVQKLHLFLRSYFPLIFIPDIPYTLSLYCYANISDRNKPRMAARAVVTRQVKPLISMDSADAR